MNAELLRAVKSFVAQCERAKTIEQVPDTDGLARLVATYVAEIKARRSDGAHRNRVPTRPFYVERIGEWQIRDKDDCVFGSKMGKKQSTEESAALNAYYGYDTNGDDMIGGM